MKSVPYTQHPWLVILTLGGICVFHCSSLECSVLELNVWLGLEWGGGDLGKQEGWINRLQRKGRIPLNTWTREIARLFHQEHQGFKIRIEASLEEKKNGYSLVWLSVSRSPGLRGKMWNRPQGFQSLWREAWKQARCLSCDKFAFRRIDSVLEIGEASNNVAWGGEEKMGARRRLKRWHFTWALNVG